MSALPNFKIVSQRDSDPNADLDCVPASIAACLEYLTGRQYTASQVKSAVYGASYQGVTDAAEYVLYILTQGCNLYPMNGDGAALVSDLHAALAAGKPALITEPDPYMSGYTHVCTAYQDTADSVTVADPWIAAPITKTDSEWAAQLQFNEVWIMEKSMIPAGWNDANGILTASNGVQVSLGFRAYIINHPTWDSADVPLAPEYHAAPVLLHNPQPGAGQRLLTRDHFLWYTDKLGVVNEKELGAELAAAYALAVATTPAAPAPALADAEAEMKILEAAAAAVDADLAK